MYLLVSYHNELWKQSRMQLKQFLITSEQLCLLRFCDTAQQLNTVFCLLQHSDKNFNASRYVSSLNKMYKYAQDLRDDYLLQLLVHKYEVEVWQTVADTQTTGGHFDRLKIYFRTNVSDYSLSKQKGKQMLAKINAEQLTSFVEFLFQKIKKEIADFSIAADISSIKKDINDYIFVVQWLGEVEPHSLHAMHIAGLKKIVELMDSKFETEKMLLIMRRININSKLQKELHKLQLVETQLNTEISDALKNWMKKTNKN